MPERNEQVQKKKNSMNLFTDQWPRLDKVALKLSGDRGRIVSRDELLREVVEEFLQKEGF